MITAVIIDDEKDARFLLRHMLEKKLGHKIQVLGEADDVGTGLELIGTANPDRAPSRAPGKPVAPGSACARRTRAP